MDADLTAMIGDGSAGGAAPSGAEACPACQTQILPGDEFCPKCGYQRGTWAAGGGAAAAQPGSTGPGTLGGPAAGPGLWRVSIAGRDFDLPAGTHVIGRGEVELRIEDGYASRRHAQLDVSADGLALTDLGSSNGTFIGEERLAPGEVRELEDGDSFRIANTEARASRIEAPAVDAAHQAPDAAPAVDSPASADDAAPADQPAAQQEAGDAVDAEGTAIDPASQIEPGKEGHTAVPHSASHWELTREGAEPIALQLGETTLGRKADKSGVVLDGDSYVSGLHCRIIVSDAGAEVTDLGSTNGTYVNEARLEPQQPWPLADGDVLRLGQTTLRVADNRAPTEAAEEAQADDSEPPAAAE